MATLASSGRTALRAAALPKQSAPRLARGYALLATRRAAAGRAAPLALAAKSAAQQVRGVKTLDFAGTKEEVYERSDWPLPKLQDYFKASSHLRSMHPSI